MLMIRHRRNNEFLHRLVAVGCIALVFMLGVFAASPSLHTLLHHPNESSADDDCAVILFANGISTPLTMVAVMPPLERCEKAFALPATLCLKAPRYMHLPGRGPPAS